MKEIVNETPEGAESNRTHFPTGHEDSLPGGTALIAYPRVYLVSRPSIDWNAVASFLSDEKLPEATESVRAGDDPSAAITEIAARLCYMSFGRGRRDIADFVENLLSHKDGSVLEHINYGFVITGVSRSLTHELVRHRAGFAYSQRSQRYVAEDACAFVVPPAIVDSDSDLERRQFADAMSESQRSYSLLVQSLSESVAGDFPRATERRKAVRSAARSVLPNATETKIFVTANVRAWRHFIEMRASEYADAEIRRLALAILEILRDESPMMFGDFIYRTDTDGTRAAYPRHSKV